jgi:TraM recognition site of TraD and TraG
VIEEMREKGPAGWLRSVVWRTVAALLCGVLAAGMVELLLESAKSLRSLGAESRTGLTLVFGLAGGTMAFFFGRGSLRDQVSLVIADLSWSRNDFCRGWYISGTTGSGKTEALKLLMHLLCRSETNWGGLFIDEKSFFIDEVLPILARYRRSEDVIELRTAPQQKAADWRPPFRFNILGDEAVRTSQYVEAILMVAETVANARDDKGFFRTQAGLHIGAAIDLFRGLREWQKQCGVPERLRVAPTLRGVYEILSDEESFLNLLRDRTGLYVEARTAGEESTPGRHLIPDFRGIEPPLLLQSVEHFRKRYWSVQAAEQLEGVKGTITNYLRWFTDDAIHEVFGAEEANFTMSCIDQGKLICVSLPQRYAIERRYICALLKVLAYAHAKQRNPSKTQYNLMVIWQDEAQRFILPVDGDVDILRQYHVTTVISTQFRAQLEKALGGKENATPILGNLRNRIILQAADEECAEESAKFIGRGLRRKRSYTRQQHGSRSSSYSDEIGFVVEPYQLRKLPKFVAVFCHSAGHHRILQFTPLDNKGEIPSWFMGLALPVLRLKLLFGAKAPVYCRYAPREVRLR